MTAASGQFSFSVSADIGNATQALAQLEQRITSVGAAALRSLNLRFDIIDKQKSAQDIAEMERNVNGLRQRLRSQGIDVPIRVNVREAEKDILNFKSIAEGSLRGLFRGTGFGGGVPIGLGFGAGAASIVLAGQATEALTRSLIQGFQAGIQYNSMLEQSTLQLTRYTGSATAAGKVLADLTKYADATPFGTEETIKVGTELLRVTDGNVEKMGELLKLAGALAVTNPYQGLEGASYAIRELLAGDTQSFADRFNVSRTLLQQLRRESADTTEFVKLAVSAAGGSEQLIAGMSQTFQGRLSTIQSFVAQLGQSLTQGFFTQLSSAAGEATQAIDEHGQAWKDTAVGVGLASAFIIGKIGEILKVAFPLVNLLAGITGPKFEELGRGAREKQAAEDRSRVPVQQLPEYDAASKVIEESNVKLHDQQVALDEVNLKLKDNSAALARVNRDAESVTNQYKQQLAPLEHQLAILQRPDFARQQRIARLDEGIATASLAGLRAGPSPELQGQVAQQRVILDVASRLQQIENRRAEIAQDFVDAAQRGKSALEQQAEAQDQVVKKLQDEHQAAQDARAVRLEGLRAEVELVKESRQERLDGLREEQRAAQDARREVIDGLREQQRTSQETRNSELEALRDLHRQQAEGIQDADREAERAHRSQMSRYQDQIDKLREQLDAQKDSGKTAAERALDALDAQERAHDRAQSLADALRGIREAHTVRERLDRLRQLQELQHDQEVAKKREQLQAQIEQEKEARDKKREQIQQQINDLERKGREEDRAYQKEREQRQEANEEAQRAAQQQERELERANREADRNDAKALRELERADKEADRTEAKALREEERQARAADKAEQAALKAEENAAREKDRQEQAKIREEQRQEQALTKAAADEREAQQLAREQAADARKAASDAIELQKLDLEQKLLEGQDTQAKAKAEGDKARLEAVKQIEAAEGNITQARKDYDIAGLSARITEIKDEESKRLYLINLQKDALTEQKLTLEAQKQEVEAITEHLKEAVGQAQALQGRLRGQPDQPIDGGDTSTPAPTAEPAVYADTAATMAAAKEGFKQDWEGFIHGLIDWGNKESNKGGGEFANNWIMGAANGLNSNVDQLLNSLGGFKDDLWNNIASFWGIQSPSTKMEQEFAGGLIDGAVAGLTARGQEITDAIKAPFENVDIAGTIETLKNDVITVWDGLPSGLDEKRQTIIDSMQAPFQSFIDTYLPTLGPVFNGSGTNAVTEWINGWNSDSPVRAVSDAFQQLGGNFFSGINNFFQSAGMNAGISWTNGWATAYNNWINSAWGAIVNGGQAAGRTAQQVAQNVVQTSSGVVSGAVNTVSSAVQTVTSTVTGGTGWDALMDTGETVRDYYARIDAERRAAFSGENVAEARHSGGQVGPGSLYQLQNGEWLAQFTQPGLMIPNGTMRSLTGSGLPATEGAQSFNVNVNIHPNAVQVSTPGVDETGLSDRIGQRVVMAITGAIDEAQRFAPKPAKKTLGGAR